MSFLTIARWSPYVVGVGIGILSWISFFVSDKPIACSTTFAKASGMIERRFRGDEAAKKPYYEKIGLSVDWQWMLVTGLVMGSFLSAQLSGSFHLQPVPPLWEAAFGSSFLFRNLAALVGGMFIGFGARWADGCTSGHGISGTLQLALSSWVSAVFFFVGGIVTAALLFGLGG
ncbi:YeeE/YedE thiosulfate transporter family protein [Anoxynatronum buryatiense]|uniref:Sulphur transport domain-containing protein n=1 Tax=Anoxynatronum buryatiense TaxID=489973 RepID=A0AA46AIR1_9CLOT|nr:YeeE/YedE thiosulfate transporter family protein [Anoxynatronum buryatiense]SMP53685.1 hypothetical protein SAMN06296020_10538 [Anoxynatronum buryatiense]